VGARAANHCQVCEQSTWPGLDTDEAANEAGDPRMTRAEGKVSAWVIPADEDLMIAQHTRRRISTSFAAGSDEPTCLITPEAYHERTSDVVTNCWIISR
jgi:hypothetical protein